MKEKHIIVNFKLHAPGNTTVEASLLNGKIEYLKVVPESRRKGKKWRIN
jgi:hypothetical protein